MLITTLCSLCSDPYVAPIGDAALPVRECPRCRWRTVDRDDPNNIDEEVA